MTIDLRFIPAFSIETVILDKDTGAPLSGGQVYFEQDNQRGTLKPVWQITGTSPDYTFTQLPNPMTLSSIGTFEDALGNPVVPYFYPFDSSGFAEYYYVRVESSTAVTQFVRESVPYISDDVNPSALSQVYSNEISNPQFSEVLFDTVSASAVFTFTGAVLEEVEIAPDWMIVVSGTGTVTVSQTTPVGSLNRITNAGTLLNINSSGITALRLRQRIYGSPNLWGSGYISASFVGKTFAGTSSVVTMYYSQSNGLVNDEPIIAATLDGSTGAYTQFFGSAFIPASNSSESFPDAYIEIDLDLPISTNIELTSVQVVSTGGTAITTVPYEEQSQNRQEDFLFHYYKPQLEYKPIPSYLVGWDFPLNPAQFLGSTVAASAIGANKSKYVWDQTIIFQSADSGVGVTRGTAGQLVLTAAATTQMAVIQYLDATQARKILNAPICCNISAKASVATNATVSLWYTTDVTLPVVTGGTNNSIVLTLDANGKPATRNGTWTEVPLVNGSQVLTIGLNATTNFNDYPLQGWDMEGIAACNTATFFAIVVGTASVASTNTISFNSISLQAGNIPTRPAPQTADEVLRECQYYYEKSYDNGIVPGATVGAQSSEILRNQVGLISGGNIILRSLAFDVELSTVKRTPGALVVYSPITGTVDRVRGSTYSGTAAFPIVLKGNQDVPFNNWQAWANGTKSFNFFPQNVDDLITTLHAGDVTNPQGFISFHYTCDARLGIV